MISTATQCRRVLPRQEMSIIRGPPVMLHVRPSLQGRNKGCPVPSTEVLQRSRTASVFGFLQFLLSSLGFSHLLFGSVPFFSSSWTWTSHILWMYSPSVCW